MQVQQQKNGRRKPERASPMADKSDVPWKSYPSVPLRLHSCEALKVCRSPTELSVKNPYETLQVRFCRPGFHRTAAIFWLGCKKEVWSRLVDLSDFFFFLVVLKNTIVFMGIWRTCILTYNKEPLLLFCLDVSIPVGLSFKTSSDTLLVLNLTVNKHCSGQSKWCIFQIYDGIYSDKMMVYFRYLHLLL